MGPGELRVLVLESGLNCWMEFQREDLIAVFGIWGEIKSWILVRGLQQDDGNLNRVQNDFFSTVGRYIAGLQDLNLDIGPEDWKTS